MPDNLPASLEHVPVASYHLLRRLDEGTINVATLFGTDDGYAVQFLTSRGLALLKGTVLRITESGRAIGEVSDERGFSAQAVFAVALASPLSDRRPPRSVTSQSKQLSETLGDAAQNIDQLSRAHMLILLRQAVKVLKLGEDEASKLAAAANDDSSRSNARH